MISLLKQDVPEEVLEEVNISIQDIIQERIQFVLDGPVYNSFRLTLQNNVNNLKQFKG